jgi:hypothetical protein
MTPYEYFQQHDGYFWQWEDGGEVAAIPGGNTIAYKSFIADVMEKLMEQGLPRFGSVLLVLIATNSNSEDSLLTVRRLVEPLLGEAIGDRKPLESALDFLKELSSLPLNYRQGKNRLLLLHTLFANAHNRLSYQDSKMVCDSFRRTAQVGGEWLTKNPFKYSLYHKDFRAISLLASKFGDKETLMKELAALPLFEEEIRLEESEAPDKKEKDFIDILIENNRTFHVGSLVRRLWSGLNIPHHNSLPSRQPLGGVSDLTNKGELHRLLISEYANEDTFFLYRLANNEALYFNREVPPENNDLERIVLIDVSIKNWGTPKTIAYALLLAIARHPKTDIACSAFAVGESVHPIRFGTPDELIEALQLLEPCLHPAKGLQSFLKEWEGKKNKEIFFISSGEAYRQPALQKLVADHYTFFNYWIHTNAAGGVDLYKRQQNSKKHVQHLQLPLEDLWKKEPPPPKAMPSETGNAADYPILFPVAPGGKALRSEAGEFFCITHERALLRLYDASYPYKRGWVMLHEKLPSYDTANVGHHKDGYSVLLLFNGSNRNLTMYNARENRVASMVFPEWKRHSGSQFFFFGDRFYFFSSLISGKCWSFRLEEEIIGECLESIPQQVADAVLQNRTAVQPYQDGSFTSIFKNIRSVFINEVDNLVFGRHELQIVNEAFITLDKAAFLGEQCVARAIAGHGFRFPDGSTVKVSRNGMLILTSSNEAFAPVYVPSVVQTSLGLATSMDFAGNEYYHFPEASGRDPISPKRFWMQYITPFIETIKRYGT